MAARVLLIEDTRDVRMLLRLVFEGADFEVVGEAENGQDGVALAQQEAPDAVVVDWQMPVMDGLEALPLLRAALPDGVIVMFSSRLGTESSQQALAAGADEYIEKGADPSVVVESVRRHLRARPAPG